MGSTKTQALPHAETGARLRSLRQRLGLNQADFAKELGFRFQSGYQKLESGRHEPSNAVLRRIHERFGVTPEEILVGGPPSDEAAREWGHLAVLRSLSEDRRRDIRMLTVLLSEDGSEGQWVREHFQEFISAAKKGTVAAARRWSERQRTTTAAEPSTDRYYTGRTREPVHVEREDAPSNVVPLFRIAAGAAIETVEAGDEYAVPEHLASERIAYAMKVTGSSMIDAGIRDEDVVFIRRTSKTTRTDSVVVRKRGTNEVTLKQVYHRGEDVELRPANPDMSPTVWKAKDVIIEGVVVALERPAWRAG